jgi:protoporphyrinogen oxidase
MSLGRVVIIGAGPTGLGAAYQLHKNGHDDFVLLDASETVGGLAASMTDTQGFTWDIGGHVQFSHYAYYDSVLDSLKDLHWLEHQRESWVWVRDRFVPYPFQNNIHRLDSNDRDRILRTMRDAAARREHTRQPANFREWILWNFGEGIADIFLFPYNFKVWAHPAEMLSREWVGERVSVPDLERVERNIRDNRDDVSWGPNSTFRFPLHGGTGAIWRALARTLPEQKIRRAQRVVAVDAERRMISLANGRQEQFDVLVNTSPITQLVAMTRAISPQISEMANKLRHSTTHIIGIGLQGFPPDTLSTKCWMYFPDTNSPYYRVTVFSNYSPFNVPQQRPCWSLMAEVSESAYKSVDREGLVEQTIGAMEDDRLIQRENIVSTWYHTEAYGYPIPTVGRDAALNEILPHFEGKGIFSRGRFGAWKYEVSNQDHSFMQGVELVERLMHGGNEPTLNQPDLANSGVFLKPSQT